MKIIISLIISVIMIQGASANERAGEEDNDFNNLHKLYEKIDSFMGNGEMQLRKIRDRDRELDTSLIYGQKSNFGDQITLEVTRNLETTRIYISDYIHNIYRVPNNPSNQLVGLTSHQYCSPSRQALESILRNSNKLSDKEISLADRFIQRINESRLSRSGATAAWAAFSACLAYSESLGDPDTPTSQARAKELLGADYNKPPGVKFYYDHRHRNPASRWNVGLFQFVLKQNGNIGSCVDAWLSLDLPGSDSIGSFDQQSMGRFVGSPSQSFNAFCGLNKLLQSFYIQVYTTDPKRTNPANLLNDATLKRPAERCVSPYHGRAYSHFSPPSRGVVYSDHEFRRSGNRSNLHKLLRCTMSALKD